MVLSPRLSRIFLSRFLGCSLLPRSPVLPSYLSSLPFVSVHITESHFESPNLIYTPFINSLLQCPVFVNLFFPVSLNCETHAFSVFILRLSWV